MSSTLPPLARDRVLAVLADLAGELHPGTRWHPVIERDRPQPDATAPLPGQVTRARPGRHDPDPVRRQRATPGDDDTVDRRRDQPPPATNVKARPQAA